MFSRWFCWPPSRWSCRPAARLNLRFRSSPNSVRLALIGDFGNGGQFQADVARQMVKSRAIFPFEFVISLGDNLLTGSQPSDFDKDFAVPYKPLLDAGVLFYASLGNHDKTNERFYKPFNMNGESYYTYKKGNARFFVLNSNYMDPKQTAWLEAQLRDAGNGDWKICYFHHPLYSSADPIVRPPICGAVGAAVRQVRRGYRVCRA